MTEKPSDLARRVLPLIDLTSLNDAHDDDIPALCAKAVTPFGAVAAVCSWPEFTAQMVARMAGRGPRVAVVVNFPAGGTDIDAAVAEARGAVDAGADELDLVWPFKAWLAGDPAIGPKLVAAVKATAGTAKLKVILETGALKSEDAIAEVSAAAIEAGADLLKTSTGKIAVGATPFAAAVILGAIRDAGKDVGLKASGGIRNLADAETYVALAERLMGADWVTPAHLRIGASRLLDDVLAALEGG